MSILKIRDGNGNVSEILTIRGQKGEPGTDATVTADKVKSVLGYTPANQTDIENLSEAIDALNSHDWFTEGTSIPADSDLNDYTTAGKYYVGSTSIAGTIKNAPVNNSNYKLYVIVRTTDKSISQIVFALNNKIYMRSATASGALSGWKTFATTDDFQSLTIENVSESQEDGGSNVITFSDGKTLTVNNGKRGSSIYRVTTAPSSYTTTTGGFTPKYRIALSTVLSQSGATEVRVGDTILRNYYTYPVGYVDASYVYVGAYSSIRGTAGAAATFEITGATALAYGAAPTVTEQSGSTAQARKYALGIPVGKPGDPGEDGYTPQRGVDYWTPTDKAEIEAHIADELAKRGQLKPEPAESLEWLKTNGDTSKIYVLPDGYLYMWLPEETAGSSVPNFTNLMDDPKARIEENRRYSSSSGWKTETGIYSLVFPFKHPGGTSTIRIRGVSDTSKYEYFYTGDAANVGTDAEALKNSITNHSCTTDENGDVVYTVTYASALNHFATVAVEPIADKSKVIVTLNEPITYTTTEGGTEYQWVNTGRALVPADYEDRIVTLESGLAVAKEDIETLRGEIGGVSIGANATTAFSTPAYCPTPQQPADGTSDFHGLNVTTAQAYAYMDALAAKHKGYVTKQMMGKDQSGAYDHNRYILCKAYWRAWLKPNYPMMFAWKNGNTTVYSVSVSPRVGDTMYTTPYIGTAYSTVTAVNPSAPDAANGIPGTPSTRTVNGLVFTRYPAGDIEPTVVYTKVAGSLADLNGGTVYNSAFGSHTKVTAYTKEAITCADGIVYTRYPFADLKADKTKPLSVFILANEHGHWGDNKVPSISLMRMAKDLCENRENPFLQWLKENTMLTLVPVGNPWGYDPSAGDNGAGYNNSRGVNINRNYDTPGWAGSDNNYGDGTTFGAYPGSENETQHIMNTMHLCRAKVGLSMHGLGLGQSKNKATEYTDGLMWQGCGFDKARMTKVAEVLFSDYGQLIQGHTSGDQSYEYCGKSPAYIQYVGAVGGLNEIPDIETGTLDLYTPTVMEASYTQMLLFLQTWCEEALEKMGQ